MKNKVFSVILLFALSISMSIGQAVDKKRVVTGLVTDIQNNPISDAIILVDGENTNTTTDNRGYFKISVKPDADSIIVIALNYPTGKAAIEGKTIVFRLYQLPDSTSTKKKMVVGDKKTYGQDDLIAGNKKIDGKKQKYDAYNNIYEMLRGIPGVQVIKGDGLSRTNRVVIRGEASITGITSPLFIVNGMQRNDIDDIMPNMVKNIEVLKGASASVYGTRGAAGVILITLE